MNAPNSEFVSLADVLALALEARSLTDESISLEDEATVTKLLMHAPLDQEDPKGHPLMNKMRAALSNYISSASQGCSLSLSDPSPAAVNALFSSLLPLNEPHIIEELAAEISAQASSLASLSSAEHESMLGKGRRMRGSDGFIAMRPSDGFTASEVFAPMAGGGGGGGGGEAPPGGSIGWAAVLDDLDDVYDDEGGGLVDLIMDKRLSHAGFQSLIGEEGGLGLAGGESYMSRKSNGSQMARRNLDVFEPDLLASDDDGGSMVFGGLGLDVEALVKQLESPRTRLAALKKMLSSNVYPDDLCFAPCWQRLFTLLSSVISVSLLSPDDEGRVSVESREEEGRLALALIERLADECLTSSPLHTAFLLSTLHEPMAVSFLRPAPHSPSSPTLSDGATQENPSLLSQLETEYPVGMALANLAHSLASSCSSDWHILKTSSQNKVAGAMCKVLSLTFSTEPRGGSCSPGVALIALDSTMKWWRRMVSCGGPGCAIVFEQAFESGFTSSLLSFLLSDGIDSRCEIDMVKKELACICTVTLVGSPAPDANPIRAEWRRRSFQSLCNVFCTSTHREDQCSEWERLLVSLASSQPHLFSGQPSQGLTCFLLQHSLLNEKPSSDFSAFEPLSRLLEALSESLNGSSVLLESPTIIDCMLKSLDKLAGLADLGRSKPLATICFAIFRALGKSRDKTELSSLMAACEQLAVKQGDHQGLGVFLSGLALSCLEGGSPDSLTSLEASPKLIELVAKQVVSILRTEGSEGIIRSSILVLALSPAVQHILIEKGLASLLSNWIDSMAVPAPRPLSIIPPLTLFESLQESPSDHPPDGPNRLLYLVQSVLAWKGIASVLIANKSGKALLEKMVTWLDLHEKQEPNEVPLTALDPDVACLVSLRCFLVWADDEEAMRALDQATHIRWYLQRIIDRNQGREDETTQAASYLLQKLRL